MSFNPLYLYMNDAGDANRRALNATMEQLIRNMRAEPSYARAHPTLVLMRGDNRYVRGIEQQEVASNIIKVETHLQAVTGSQGVSRANELNPTALRRSNSDAANFLVCHRRDGFVISRSEMELMGSKGGDSMMKQRLDFQMECWQTGMANEIGGAGGAAPGSESRLMSLRHFVNNNQTVGGIDQTTATQWQANIVNGGGVTFTPEMLNGLRSKVAKRKGTIDCWLMSAVEDGVDIYNRFKEQWRGAAHVEIENGLLKVGINNIIGDGGEHYIEDFDLVAPAGTAEVVGLDLKCLTFVGNLDPVIMPAEHLNGTDAVEIIVYGFQSLVTSRNNTHAALINVA